MNNCRGKRCETNTICDSKESAEVQWAILLVRLCIEMEMGIHDAGYVVLLPGQGEEAIRKDGEVLRVVEVEPVSNGCDYVHDDEEPCCNIRSGEPGAGERAPEVGGDCGPVKTDRSNAKALQTGAELLGEHGVWEDPADPGEGGKHLEQVAWEDVVGEAADERHQEELVPRQAAFNPLFFLMERPGEQIQCKVVLRNKMNRIKKLFISSYICLNL